MLSQPDAELARRDAALPGLATLLDCRAFTEALRSRAPHLDSGPARPTYVRYKPGVSCLVGYRLGDAEGATTVTARAFPLHAREKLLTVGDPRHIVWEESGIIVSVFPHDAAIRSLFRLAEPWSMTSLLGRIFLERPAFRDGTIEELRYKPERRYVARLCVNGRPAAALKFYTESGYGPAKRGVSAIRPRGALRIARRIGHSDRHCILAFEWRPGRLLTEAIADPSLPPDSLAVVGRALAAAHAQNPGPLEPPRRGAAVAALNSVADGVDVTCPDLVVPARVIARRIADRLAGLRPVDRPIHGDFGPKQVLLDGESVVVLDFDEASVGDPTTDLGQFLAHLERESLRGEVSPDRARHLRAAFLSGYSPAIDMQRLALATAAGLFRLAPYPFRQREPDWPGRTAAILERAEAILRESAPHAPVPKRPPTGPSPCPVLDPQLPFLARALDPQEAAPLLGRSLPGLAGTGTRVEVGFAQVVRHEPGRRCLIEYGITVERPGRRPELMTLLGKARAKGMDREAYRALETLWQGDFGPDGREVQVPQPLGMVPEFRMYLMRKVPGLTATSLLPGPDGVGLAVRIADALDRLHRADPPSARRHGMAEELRILEERLSILAQARPEWSVRLHRLFASCSRLGEAVPEPAPSCIHRDFSPDHVLVVGPCLYLTDLDRCCLGDPALDVGNFVAHLAEQALRTLGDANALADREEELIDRHAVLRGRATGRSVRAYAALSLARHVELSSRFPERQPLTEALLDLCEDRLARGLAATARTFSCPISGARS
jgi:aminoglycoside phosphotransferase (APT) family kinase protein